MDSDWWLKERTFHHSQFSDPGELERLKVEQGLTISLIFPTLNEEKTIGKHIRVLKKALMLRHHLVDEIGIVDSGSVDRTREIAKKRGVQVYLADECLPELSPQKGKGENLWKSLYLFKGDILVWVDADIRNIHPRFVLGLIGPILFNPEIAYVKAFYRRPLRVGHKMVPGGGRVTELLVRPFLNLLYPDLAMLAQPLSGEYAGRRSVLERLPFFTGYGVEMGLLIDIEQHFGIRCIAQVDMDVRVHRNQGIESLRRMSYVILSVLMRRSEQLGKIALLEGVGSQLHFIRREGADYFYDAEEVRGRERPPILSVPAYQEKYGILPDDAVLVDESPETERLGSCVTHIINQAYMKLDLPSTTREEAVLELLELLLEKGAVSDTEELLSGIMQREKRLSTNVGRGLALPHLTTEQVDEITIAVGRSKRGIEFSSHLIRRPVHLIFLILSPPEKKDAYLRTLACLARLLRNRKLVQDFMDASDSAEAVALLKKYEALIRLQRQLKIRSFSG
jgi:glucosyl-3-phosphoglycerate synthase